MVGVADRRWVGCGAYLSCTAPPWCLRDYQSNSNQPNIYLAAIMLLSIYFALSVRALLNHTKEASGMHHYCPSIISGCVCSVNSEGGFELWTMRLKIWSIQLVTASFACCEISSSEVVHPSHAWLRKSQRNLFVISLVFLSAQELSVDGCDCSGSTAPPSHRRGRILGIDCSWLITMDKNLEDSI